MHQVELDAAGDQHSQHAGSGLDRARKREPAAHTRHADDQDAQVSRYDQIGANESLHRSERQHPPR